MDTASILNKVPDFLQFYQRANHEHVTTDKRWELWQEHYGFAAVPPTDEGNALARTLVENAWGAYHTHIESIRSWAPHDDLLKKHLSNVKSLLGYEEPLQVVILYFVGGFEHNPFVTITEDGDAVLCLPIETRADTDDILLTHELTHVVHMKTAELTGAWERSVASTVIQEGLATQISKHFVPGHPDAAYIEHKEGWFASCQKHEKEILAGIRPYLRDESSSALTKFTFGEGTTGHDREVYYTGWVVVNRLRKKGMTFQEIAQVPEHKLPNLVEYAMK